MNKVGEWTNVTIGQLTIHEEKMTMYFEKCLHDWNEDVFS